MTDHPEAVQRFPLQWPLGWVRTRQTAKRNGAFKDRGTWIGIPSAVTRLQVEIDRLGGSDPTLSLNLKPRMDGGVVANQGEPSDSGVAVYFRFKGRATVFACDRYYRVADNIAAIAAHIEALRRIDRYGVGTIEQAIAGYRALPADSAADWRQVFGFTPSSTPTLDQVKTAHREQAKVKHPDHGGTDEDMFHINRALEFATMELR